MDDILKGPQRGFHWLKDHMKKRIYEFHEGDRRDSYLLSLKGR